MLEAHAPRGLVGFRKSTSNSFRASRWITHLSSRYFEKLNLIVFLLPISAFDQYLEEDPQVNRIQDSLDLWKSIVVRFSFSNER